MISPNPLLLSEVARSGWGEARAQGFAGGSTVTGHVCQGGILGDILGDGAPEGGIQSLGECAGWGCCHGPWPVGAQGGTLGDISAAVRAQGCRLVRQEHAQACGGAEGSSCVPKGASWERSWETLLPKVGSRS